MSKFELTKDEVEAGVKPAIVNFVEGSEYSSLALKAAEVVKKWKIEALFVPAVSMIVDATLRAVRLPSVEDRLPKEITSRFGCAVKCAEYVMELALSLDAFNHFYRAHQSEQVRVRQSVLSHFSDKEFLLSLGQAPFYDVSVVSGGGLKVLEVNGITAEGAAPILARSTGLLAISGINKYQAGDAGKFLGEPYAYAEHFLLEDDLDDGMSLTFTPQARQALSAFHSSGSGCPAGAISNGQGSLLENYWESIVNYLVPVDATAKALHPE